MNEGGMKRVRKIIDVFGVGNRTNWIKRERECNCEDDLFFYDELR